MAFKLPLANFMALRYFLIPKSLSLTAMAGKTKNNPDNGINNANKRTKIKNGNMLCGSAIPSIDVIIPYEKTIIKNDTITNNQKIRLKRM